MGTRMEIIRGFYDQADEGTRLERSRHGQLGYAVTMRYIHRYVGPGCRALEVGAGTGRYSIALAQEGFRMMAIELVESNFSILQKNSTGIEKLQEIQGDATDLSGFADQTFDITLVLGPLYHLYDQEEIHKAIDEAMKENSIPLAGAVCDFSCSKTGKD